MYIVGRVWPVPSEKNRNTSARVIAGAPQLIALR